MLLSLAAAMGQVLIMNGVPSELLCKIDIFLLPVSFGMFYSLLYIKIYRVYAICQAAKQKAVAKQEDKAASHYSLFNQKDHTKFWSKDYNVLMVACVMTLPAVIISVIWIAIDPPVPKMYRFDDSRTSSYWTCSSKDHTFQSTMLTLLIEYAAILLHLCLVEAIMAKDIPSKVRKHLVRGARFSSRDWGRA